MMNGAAIALSSSVLLCILRLRLDSQGFWSDAEWIVIFNIWAARGSLWDFVVTKLSILRDYPSAPACAIVTFLALRLASVFYYMLGSQIEPDNQLVSHDGITAASFLKPLVFPSRTSHARFFPKKHSFSYSYLLVGVPIGWRGVVGPFLSVDEDEVLRGATSGRGAWLSVRATDHLHRGYDHRGLKGKLESFLATQNESLRDYPHVYLVTAPRFLGYSFNPVSFWYLYNGSRELKAMILEVNNTFDERRVYLLKDKNLEGSDAMPGAAQSTDVTTADAGDAAGFISNKPGFRTSARFTSTWDKDFHVSPFNSRKGAYAVSAEDPLEKGTINNTITLSSSKGYPKLVARVFSTGDCMDPSKAGPWSTLRFVAAWWWVGLMTFPRIVKEAAKLFFLRKLHVWYRPEVLQESIGRQATEDERTIEQCFQGFLKDTIDNPEIRVPMKYTSPMTGIPQGFYPSQVTQSQSECQSQHYLDFTVTTPLFYSHMIRFAHLPEFFAKSLFTDAPESQIFHVSDATTFIDLFEPQANQSCFEKAAPYGFGTRSFLDRQRWHFLRLLRDRSQMNRLLTSSTRAPERTGQDIRSFPFSPLDIFAMQNADISMASRYRRAVIKVLASDIVALGQPALIDAFYTVIRILLCWIFVQEMRKAGMLLFFSMWMKKDTGNAQGGYPDFLNLLIGLCGLHLWWGLKRSF